MANETPRKASAFDLSEEPPASDGEPSSHGGVSVSVKTGGGSRTLYYETPAPSSIIDPMTTTYSRFDTDPGNIANLICASMKSALASAMGQHHYERLTSDSQISTTVDTIFSQIKHTIPNAAASNPTGTVALAIDQLSSKSYRELLALPQKDSDHDDSTPAAAALLVSALRTQVLDYEAGVRAHATVDRSSCMGLLQTAYQELEERFLLLGGKQMGGGEQLAKRLKAGWTEVAVYDTEELQEGLKEWKESFEAMLQETYYEGFAKEVWKAYDLYREWEGQQGQVEEEESWVQRSAVTRWLGD